MKCASYTRREQIHTHRNPWLRHCLELVERSANTESCELRHPFHDRKLVEFIVALSEERRCANGLPKHVLRSAMSGILPDTVRQRTQKAEFSHVFEKAFSAFGGLHAFESSSLAQLGWVNPQRVREKYLRMASHFEAGDDRYALHMWALWGVLATDLCLRYAGSGLTFGTPCAMLSELASNGREK